MLLKWLWAATVEKLKLKYKPYFTNTANKNGKWRCRVCLKIPLYLFVSLSIQHTVCLKNVSKIFTYFIAPVWKVPWSKRIQWSGQESRKTPDGILRRFDDAETWQAIHLWIEFVLPRRMQHTKEWSFHLCDQDIMHIQVKVKVKIRWPQFRPLFRRN